MGSDRYPAGPGWGPSLEDRLDSDHFEIESLSMQNLKQKEHRDDLLSLPLRVADLTGTPLLGHVLEWFLLTITRESAQNRSEKWPPKSIKPLHLPININENQWISLIFGILLHRPDPFWSGF